MSEDATLDEFLIEGKDTTEGHDSDQHLPEISDIPEDWGLATVEDTCKNILGGGTPSKSNEDYWGGDIPWASVKDLNGTELSVTEDYITESGVENSATNVVPTNSIIISTRMTVGEPFLNRVEMAINQDMKAIIPDTDIADPWFLVYSLSDKDPYLKSLGRGTTVNGITTKDLKLTHLGLPPLEEQRKIASVLYTVDQAIQKTEEIIYQTERVRKGTLQDLVTRGLNQIGELRPSYLEEPALYKETAGRTVPSEWKVSKLSDIGEWMSGKTPKKSENKFWGGSIPWISAKDMKSLRLTDSEDKITEAAVEEGAPLAPSDSLLILVRGMILDHTLPIVRPAQEVSFNQDVKAILPYEDINPDYLAYWLKTNSNEILALVTAASHGTKRLSTEALGNLSVPIPPKDEQAEIVDHINEFDRKIDIEKSRVGRLKNLKKGLMQDLLSGEVRTAGKEIDIHDEVKNHEPE